MILIGHSVSFSNFYPRFPYQTFTPDFHHKYPSQKSIPNIHKKFVLKFQVGSYILLETLSKLIVPAAIPSISAVLSGILLFPTVTHISHSPSGAKLTPLMSIPNFPVLASSSAKMLLYCAPNVVLDFLVKKITGMPEEAAKVTTSFLRSKNGILQALYVFCCWIMIFFS